MVPSTFVRNNPFQGLTVRGVRDSFDRHPVKSTAAAAVFGAAFYWALKSAQKSGPIGAAMKGFVALAIMKKAKNSLVPGFPI